MKKITKPRIGIVGTGLIGVSHVQGAKQCGRDCQITALCDVVPGKAEAFRQGLGLGEAEIFSDYRQLIDSGLCDLVAICTPNHLHQPIFTYAAQKELAILCEKPIGLDGAEVEQMARTASQWGVANLAGFTYRHIPAVLQIRQLVEEGALGEIRHFRGKMYADRMAAVEHPLEWRHLLEQAGSGVLGDLASHVLDMGLFLLGPSCGHISQIFAQTRICVPQRRDAQSGAMVAVTSDDVCNIMGQFDSGCDVVVETSRHFPFDFEIVLSGEKGMVRYSLADYHNLTLMLYDSPADYFRQPRTVPVVLPATPLDPQPTDRMARQYRYLIQCLQQGEAPSPTIADTVEIARLLDSIQLSAREQQVVQCDTSKGVVL